MTHKTINIGLIYHGFHSSNLGLDALGTAHVLMLEEICANLDLVPVFYNFYQIESEIVSETTRSDFVNIPNRRSLSLIRDFKRCDIVFDLSSGDSFTDIYGMRRSLSMLASKLLLTASGVPFVLAPQTVGPFNHKLPKWLASLVMLKSQRIFVRDQMSLNELPGFLRKKTIVTTDLAFYLPYNKTLNLDKAPISVALNVSGLLYNGGYSKKNMFNLNYDYATLIETLINKLIENNIDLCLVAHVIVEDNSMEDDYRVCQALSIKFPQVRLAPKFKNAIEAKSFISNFDFFIGSRMHASIAAFSTGIPIYAISYSRKFKGLYSNLNYMHVYDVNEHSEQQVIDSIFDNLNRLDEYKVSVSESISLAKKMNEHYMSEISNLLERISMDTKKNGKHDHD